MPEVTKDTHSVAFFTAQPRIDRLKLIEEFGYHVSCVVLPSTKKYLSGLGSLQSYCRDKDIRTEIITGTNFSAIEDIANKKNLLISSGYNRIIPEKIFGEFYCSVNFHPSLLPKNRGRYLHYVLINREEVSGCTLHLLNEKVDAGAILAQREFPVSSFDTIKSLQRKSDEVELDILKDFLSNPEALLSRAKSQDETQASTYVEKRTPADSELDENMSLKDAFYILRALDSQKYPGYIWIDGERVGFSIRRIDKVCKDEDLI